MSVFHKTMVWLGLVDDDEYYAEDEYYADEYGDPVPGPARSPRGGTATATAPAPTTDAGPLTVIRSPRQRDDAAPAPAAPTRTPSAVKPIPMPATRVHV